MERHVWIMEQCIASHSRNPIAIAEQLMRGSMIRMHGPEHHYLTAAALCTAWCRTKGLMVEEHIHHLKSRCELIQPAVCGYYGICGTVMGVGAAYSEMMGVTYLSNVQWQRLNAFTAYVQQAIADSCITGPRCCKRTTFSALEAAVRWLAEQDVVHLECPTLVRCTFTEDNPTCIHGGCVYYTAPTEPNLTGTDRITRETTVGRILMAYPQLYGSLMGIGLCCVTEETVMWTMEDLARDLHGEVDDLVAVLNSILLGN